MKLSTRAEYGTRALIELAIEYQKTVDSRDGDERTPIRPLMLQTIATRQNISKKYLEQLFLLLRKAGVIEGIRGPSGGYYLARPPEEILLDEVFEILEGPLAIADCLITPDVCRHSGFCATQEVWKQLSSAIEGTLGAISLADLIERHNCLLSQLDSFSTMIPKRVSCAEQPAEPAK